jgi:hypothetical protein
MDAQSEKIQRNENGELYLKIPDELVKQLELNEGDDVDLVPTALGVELRKSRYGYTAILGTIFTVS